MKVPANISADKLILEYLSRVTEAATRYLPKGGRIAFVGRVRSRIERECGPAGSADADRVREVLAALGAPEDLVKQERARLDAAWVKRRSPDKEAGEAAAASITQPRQHRRINSRWKPATGTQPLPVSPGGRQPGAAPGAPGGGERSGRLRGTRGGWRAGGAKGTKPPAAPSPPGSTGTPAPDETEPPVLEGTVIQAPPVPATGTPAGPGQQPAGSGTGQVPGGGQPPMPLVFAPLQPAGRGTPLARRLPPGSLTLRGGTAALVQAAGRWARNAGTLSRRHPLEAVAIAALGIGGLILPFPFWLIGGTLAVFSRFWTPRDKWIALTGPPVIALLGTLVTAMLVHSQGNPVEIYTYALRLDVGYLLRAGSVLCAVYLAVQVRRGPRVRLPPWKR